MISERDCEYICQAEFLPWEKLRGKTVWITGATGLIGRTLTEALLYADKKRGLNLKILALVRNEERARRQFSEHLTSGKTLRILQWTAEEPFVAEHFRTQRCDEKSPVEKWTGQNPAVEEAADYMIHCAAQTDSRAFVRQPVETIKTAVLGTLSLLELARRSRPEGFVFLSSMEVYGHPRRGHKVVETDVCALQPDEVRGSYPISKLLCENLCQAYFGEYGVPAKIIRLTQTFGPGVRANDTRIFAEFGRCVQDGRDIVLRTKGETERSYLYTADAAAAILTVLLKGTPGQAYNAADERTYCSVAQMAHRVASANGLGVQMKTEDGQDHGYGGLLYMDLDTSRLRALGWAAQSCKEADGDPLLYMYARMLENSFGDI